MKLADFLNNNSLHDSYITSSSYISHAHILKMKIVQLYSQLSIENETNIEVDPDEQVEMEILLNDIIHLGCDMNAVEDYEISDFAYGKIYNYDIIMLQMYDKKQIYREAYIRGQNVEVEVKILGKV